MTLNLVPFVSVDSMMKLVLHLGLERVMVDLVGSLMGKKVFDRPTRSK